MTTTPSRSFSYRFSFGPWNISEGADPFGPDTREPLSFAKKLPLYQKLGFEGVQFHDDDAVPDLDDLTPAQIIEKAKAVKTQIGDYGLVAEFVAPRLWFNPKTIDGGYTSNAASDRQYAMDRSYRTIDIMNAMGTDLMVLWLAREGTYIREAKNCRKAVDLRRAFNQVRVLEEAGYGRKGEFIGTEGSLLLPHRSESHLYPSEKFKDHPRPDLEPRNHYHHFVDDCLGGEMTESHFGQTAPMTEVILLGTVAIRVPGKVLEWNAPDMKITNNATAQGLLKRSYRDGRKVAGL